jgi:dTDP-4-dehydrorhamnose 3,5-epimerase
MRRLREGLVGMGFADKDFRNSPSSRRSSVTSPLAVWAAICAGANTATPEDRAMKFHETPLEGAYLIELEKRGPDRGFFARFFCENEFGAAGFETRFRANQQFADRKKRVPCGAFALPVATSGRSESGARSQEGALGRHSRFAGRFADIPPMVRRRAGRTQRSDYVYHARIWTPVRHAHRQCRSALFDFDGAFYSPEAERGLRWNVTAIRISWPAEPQEMWDKDRIWPDLDPKFHGVEAMRGLT